MKAVFSSSILALSLISLVACGGGGGDGPSGPNGGAGGNVAGPALAINDASVVEGNSSTADVEFTVTLSAVAATDVTVDYTTIDGEADASDYTPASGTLTVLAGSTTAQLRVSALSDTEIELDESFSVQLNNPVGATLSRARGIGTIENDDFPFLTIADSSLVEGDSGATAMEFDVSLDRPGLGEITVDYAASDAAAVTGDDYTAITGTVTINEGDVAAVISIDILGDTRAEPDEQFVVNLSNASANARIAVDEAIGLIVNDDVSRVSIAPAGITEADSGSQTLILPVILDAPAAEELTVTYTTSDLTATAGEDYSAAQETLVIAAGQDSAFVPIEVFGDTTVEPIEQFEVLLSDLQGPAVLDQPLARAMLLDTDGGNDEPTLYLQPASVLEGDAGATQARFLFILSVPLAEDLSFDATTSALTATAGIDYEDVSTTLTIPAGMTSTLLPVNVVGDQELEGDETFTMAVGNLSVQVALPESQVLGTIADDDGPDPEDLPQLTIRDASVLEGNTGTVELTFDVELDKPAAGIVAAMFSTEDGSALAGADYTASSGQVSLPAGAASARITVSVISDTFSEDDETFVLRLSGLTGEAEFARSFAIGTILTDEALVRLSVADTGGEEGDTNNTQLSVAAQLDIPAQNVVSFDYATTDVSALAGEDYIAASGSLQIQPGETRVEIPLTIIADSANEPDESFELTISNVSTNAIVTDSLALVTIVNDDGTPGWQEPSTLGGGFKQYSLTMDSSGNGAAVFPGPTSIATFLNDVLVTRFSAGAWQAPEPVGAYTASIERVPQVVMLDSGRILAAWVTPGSVDSALYTPGGTWVGQSAGGEGGFFLDLAGNAAGNAALAWESLGSNVDPSDILRNRFDGVSGTWGGYEFGENDDTDDAREPMVLMDSASNVFVYWRQSFADTSLSGTYFDYYESQTDSWRGATRVPDTAVVDNVYGAMLPDGRPAVIGQSGATGLEVVAMWAYDPATDSWSSLGSPQPAAAEDSVLPKFAVGGDGNIVAAWFQSPVSAEFDVYANRYDPLTGTWGTAVLLENADGSASTGLSGLDVAVDDNSNAIVVWSQDVGAPGVFDFRIRASRYTASDGLWSPPEQIDDENLQDRSFGPRIEMDAAGNAIVIWYYDDVDEIGATRYVAP